MGAFANKNKGGKPVPGIDAGSGDTALLPKGKKTDVCM